MVDAISVGILPDDIATGGETEFGSSMAGTEAESVGFTQQWSGNNTLASCGIITNIKCQAKHCIITA